MRSKAPSKERVESLMRISALRIFSLLLILWIALFGPIRASAFDKQQQPVLKVGFIMVGSVSDMGWNHAHEQGRLYFEDMQRKAKKESRYQITVEEFSRQRPFPSS